MKTAIIGAGNSGGKLGQVWLAKGHEIVFGAWATAALWIKLAKLYGREIGYRLLRR